MASKLLIAGSANYAANKVSIEFPAVASLVYAAFFGDGSLNPQDGVNLAGTGAFTNIGSGPTLSPAYGTFTRLTNALLTTAVDTTEISTHIFVVRNTVANLSAILGVKGVTFGYMMGWTGGGPNNITALPLAGVNNPTGLTGIPVNTWKCVALLVPANGSFGSINDLALGTSVASSAARALAGGTGGTFAIGDDQGEASAPYNHPCDIAFAMGAKSAISPTNLGVAYQSLKQTLALRGIAI